MAALLSALPMILIVRQAAGGDLFSLTTAILLVLALLPLLVSFAVGLSLRNAREQILFWLAQHPFRIENLNNLLSGISDEFEIYFKPTTPLLSREQLQKRLDSISDDILALRIEEEQQMISIKIGIIDSKALPLRSNFLRYKRFQQIVDDILLPLHEQRPIRIIRVL